MHPAQPPTPPQQPQLPQQAAAWFGRLKRPQQIAVGCGGLILACILISVCGSLASAVGGGNNSTSTSTSTAHQATNTPQATHAPTATPKPKTWQTVKHFSGTGNTQTDSFDIRNGDHVVSSCTTDSSDANLFIADLYQDGTSVGNDLPWASLVDRANQPCSKQTYTIHEGDAKVYLHVESDSVTWTIDVQRFQ